MPFEFISKFAKSRKDIYKEIPGLQTRREVAEILLEVIKNRRSIRKYQNTPVPDNVLLEILNSARYAPSMGNQQPWEFIVVKDQLTKEHLAEACYNQEWMLEAPVIIVACQNMRLSTALYGERGSKLYGVQAVAAAIENILLTAEALELGSSWIGEFSERNVSIAIGAPDFVRPAAVITLGYAAEKPPGPLLQNLDEVVHLERFGQTIFHKKVKKEKKPSVSLI